MVGVATALGAVGAIAAWLLTRSSDPVVVTSGAMLGLAVGLGAQTILRMRALRRIGIVCRLETPGHYELRTDW